MAYAIHVPQGRCARYTKGSPSFLSGIYTDGFSNCTIFIGLNEKQQKFTLAHIDGYPTHSEFLGREINWLSNDDDAFENIKIVLIHRKASQVHDRICQLLSSENYPGLNSPISIELEETHDGIFFTPIEQAIDNSILLEQHISALPTLQEPPNVARHPHEQEITTVQKIRQIIGLREFFETKKLQDKQTCIFDGRNWVPMDSSEWQINTQNEWTKEELSSFKLTDSFIDITGKIAGLAEHLISLDIFEANSEALELGKSIAPHIEMYLNNYDHIKSLRNNLLSILKHYSQAPDSKKGKKIYSAIKKELSFCSNFRKKTKELLEKDSRLNPDHFENFKSELGTYIRLYDQREAYSEIRIAAKKATESINQFLSMSGEKYCQGEFEAAKNLAESAVELSSRYCLKSDPQLFNSYFSLSRSLYLIPSTDLDNLKFVLNYAIELGQQHCTKKMVNKVKLLNDILCKLHAPLAQELSSS